MPDNVPITAGAGTDVAADNVLNVYYQRVKVTLGADGVVDEDLQAGQRDSDHSLPVVIATDQSAVVVTDGGGTVSVDDGSGSITVDGSTTDGGPAIQGTWTYTPTADLTTAAPIGPAPAAGEHSRLRHIILGSLADVGLTFDLEEETSGTVFGAWWIPPKGGLDLYFPDAPKLATADRRWCGKASVAGALRITTITYSEA